MVADIAVYTATVDPASVTASSNELDVTVPGVKAANTVSIQFLAAGVGAVDGASETYTFVIAHVR
jgi:hypothetical protein